QEGRLKRRDLLKALLGEPEKLVQLPLAEGRFLARALDLDEAALAGHHDVEVHLSVLVLDVGEVEERHVPEKPRADRGDGVRERALPQPALVNEPLDREARRDVGSRDRGGARSPVGLQDIAVDPERVRAQPVKVDDGAKGPAYQALDLHRASVEPALVYVARLSLM